MNKGQNKNYYWVQTFDTKYTIHKFLDEFRHYLVEKYICITAFDSGNLQLSETDYDLGWQEINKVATSPPISVETHIPTAGFDEWYVFTNCPTELKINDVFVNYAEFRLEENSDLNKNFWHNLEHNKPNIYIAEGTSLIIISTNQMLIQEIEKTWS